MAKIVKAREVFAEKEEIEIRICCEETVQRCWCKVCAGN